METLVTDKPKFSFHQFLIKITSRKFAVYVTSVMFVREILKTSPETPVAVALIICWGIFGALYFIGSPLSKAISNAVSNTKIDVNLGK